MGRAEDWVSKGNLHRKQKGKKGKKRKKREWGKGGEEMEQKRGEGTSQGHKSDEAAGQYRDAYSQQNDALLYTPPLLVVEGSEAVVTLPSRVHIRVWVGFDFYFVSLRFFVDSLSPNEAPALEYGRG